MSPDRAEAIVEVRNYLVHVRMRQPDAEIVLWCEPQRARDLAAKLLRCADEADRRRAAMGKTDGGPPRCPGTSQS